MPHCLNRTRKLCIALLAALLVACSPQPGDGGAALDAHRGQWVLVNYWARWCKPCIKEIPELNALDREREDVTVLGVNYDGLAGEALAAQLDDLGVEFATLAADPAAELGTQRPVVLPTTFILDPGGRLVSTLVGPQTLETLEQALLDAGAHAG